MAAWGINQASRANPWYFDLSDPNWINGQKFRDITKNRQKRQKYRNDLNGLQG